MPSRRIASSTNLSPLQDRALNPFTSFDSNNVNKLTRIVSNGKDGVVEGLEIKSFNKTTQSIKNIPLLQSGLLYNNNLKSKIVISEEDRNAGKIVVVTSTPSNSFKGFKFKNLTDIEARTVTYKVSPNAFGFSEYIHTNTTAVFTFEFDLESGSPREIIASVGNSNSSVIYPRNLYTNHVKIQVLHNFNDDEINNDLDLNLTVVVDPFDTYNEYAYCSKENHPEFYNGQSEIKVDKIKYQLDILSFESKKEFDQYSDDKIFYKYSSTRVHPSKTLYVTPGVAIKDDVMLDEKGIDKKNNTPILELNVSDPKNWIKGNPFHYSDFQYDGAEQYGYIFNKYDENNKLNGVISTSTGDLTFKHNTIKDIPLIDDLTPSKYDIPLNWHVISNESDENSITVKFEGLNTSECAFYNDLQDLYGNSIYCISKHTGEVVCKSTLNSTRYEGKIVFTTDQIRVFNTINIRDKIDFVVPLGPIKVSGDFKKVNPRMVRWANVVVYYSYFKHPTPNTSYIGLIRDEDLHDPKFREDYLVLGEVRFISPTQIDIISYGNRQSFHKPENQARNIDYVNGLSYEENLEWVDADGHPQNPGNVSQSITLLLSLIKNYYNKAVSFQRKYAIIENENKDLEEYDREIDDEDGDNFDITFIKNTNPEVDQTNTRVLHKAYIDLDGQRTELTLNVLKRLIKPIDGKDGQVLWHLDESYTKTVCDWLMQNGYIDNDNYNIYVCNTEKDVIECKNDVYGINNFDYTKWIKFGHVCRTDGDVYTGINVLDEHGDPLDHPPLQYGITEDYPASEYDQNGNPDDLTKKWWWGADTWIVGECSATGKKVVSNVINTNEYTGFVTDNVIHDYDIILRCFTTNDRTGKIKYINPDNGTVRYYGNQNVYGLVDNDTFCFVAGFTTDSNGNQHTISFYRSGDLGASTWGCILDKNEFYFHDCNSQRTLIRNEKIGSTYTMLDEGNGLTNWNLCGDGVLIRVIRTGNVFRAYTSKQEVNKVNLTENDLLQETEIILDLDNLTIQRTNYDPEPIQITDPMAVKILNLFKTNGIHVGFGELSQPTACFEIMNHRLPGIIIDSKNHEVWRWNDNSEWEISSEDEFDVLSAGRLSYNSITRKLFWNDGKDIFEIDLNPLANIGSQDGQFLKSSVDINSNKKLTFDWLMNNGIYKSFDIYGKKYNCYVVDNDNDFEFCKNYIKTEGCDVTEFSRFAHTAGNAAWPPADGGKDYIAHQYGIDSDYETLFPEIVPNFERSFSADDYFCFSDKDHNGQSGFVSVKKYNNYDISARFYGKYSLEHNGIEYISNDDDQHYHNDAFGIVASFITDSNGNQHTLTFTRSGGNNEYVGPQYAKYWTLELDRNIIFRSTEVGEFRDSTAILCDNNKNVPDNTPSISWSRCGDGSLIHVKRKGNVFTAWTSQRVINGVYNKDDPSSGTIYELEKSKIILDLNNFTISTYSDSGTEMVTTTFTDERALKFLRMFKNKPSQWAFCKCGYMNVGLVEFLKCPEMESGVDLIIHKTRNQVWIHDFYGWKLTDKECIKTIGSGKLSYNSITQKLFWNDGENIIPIDLTSKLIPSGSNGEVLYKSNEEKVEFGKILYNNIAVCETTSDAEKCKTKIDYNEIYSKWIKIGYYQNQQYKIDADYCSTVADGNIGAKQWHWNETKHAVENQSNSVDMSGFVCTNPSKMIDVTVRFLSTNTDDDWNGLCLMTTDKNGRQHTISFLRNLQVTYLNYDPSTIYSTTDTKIAGEVVRYRGIIRSTETPDPTKTYYTPAKDGTTGYKALTGLTTWPADICIYEKVTCKACKSILKFGPQQFYAVLDVNQNTSYTMTNSDSLRPENIDDPTNASNRKIIETPVDTIVDFYANYHQYSGTTEKMPKETIGEYYYSIFENSTPVKYGSWEFGQKARTCPVYMQPAIDDYRLCVPRGTLQLFGTSSTGKSISDSYSNASAYANDFTINQNTAGNQLDKSKFQRHGWAGFSGGVVLHMTYQQVLDNDGNVDNVIIECETTPFMTEKTSTYQLKSQYKIRIDLKDIITNGKVTINTNDLLNTVDYTDNQIEILKLFMNPKGVRWGYLNGSQAGSTFENIRIITDNNPYIVDRESDKSYMFDGTNWNEIGNSYDILLPGRQYYNSLLDRLYWCDLEKNIVKIASSSKDIEQLMAVYPVGSIYIGTQAICPFEGVFGTWVKVSQGKCLWGADATHNPGTEIAAGIPKFTGTGTLPACKAGGGASSFTKNLIHYGSSTATHDGDISATLSIDSDAIYGNSTTVQPPAFVVNMWQRTA